MPETMLKGTTEKADITHSRYLSNDQIEAIMDILIAQCNLIEQRDTDDTRKYPTLYDEDYSRGRTHDNTSCVYAGFRKGTQIAGLMVSKKKYGCMHVQPQLEGDTVVVQLYNAGSSLDTNEVRSNCKRYNVDDAKKHYVVLQFKMSKSGHLSRVHLIDFDQNGSIISREEIYRYVASIKKISA